MLRYVWLEVAMGKSHRSLSGGSPRLLENVENGSVSQEESEIPGRISGIPFDTSAFDQFGER